VAGKADVLGAYRYLSSSGTGTPKPSDRYHVITFVAFRGETMIALGVAALVLGVWGAARSTMF
jgi:hypothetical protein